jgi:hypothetical protein
MAAVPASASQGITAKLNGCWTIWNDDYADAKCAPATAHQWVWDSVNCSWLPGKVGAKKEVWIGSNTGLFDHLSCGTSITSGFIHASASA